MEETGELPRLNLPTWPLCTQGARNVSWLHGSILPLRPWICRLAMRKGSSRCGMCLVSGADPWLHVTLRRVQGR